VICKKNSILFTANTDTAVMSKLVWDFGDGTIEVSKQQAISHVYNQPGNYTVVLFAINESNCNDTLIKYNYIRVNGPLAKFTDTGSIACYNKPITFADSSMTDGINEIQNWEWNFGDGVTVSMNAPPFQHLYNRGGNYMVSLKVTDASGCSNTYSRPTPIKIIKPSAFIIAYDTIACTNKTVRLIAPYAEPGITYRWDLGNGDTASNQKVNHQYKNVGAYTIGLIINNYQYGCSDTSVRTGLVRIEDPVAKFTMSDSFKTCPPLMIQFTNLSVNAVDELWDFGDGSSTTNHTPSHFYSYPGIYTVTLTVKGKGGCSSQVQKQIIVKGPRGTISYNPFNICLQQQVGFKVHSTDAVSYIWDFNDGTTVNNADTIAQHTYTNAGGYMPKIMLVDEMGCKVPVTGKDTVEIRAPFKMTINKPGKLCIGKSANLQASGAAIYQWSPVAGLDNAATATPVARPVVTTAYTIIGTDDKGCFSDTGYVTVEVAANPVVDAGADRKISAGTALDLVPAVSGDVTEVHWSPTSAIFRNSESGITVKPNESTEYTVEVKNAAGCMASDKVNITITKAAGELFIPNAFSPNGDGVNDVFYPRSAVAVKVVSLKILNRFGALVFERAGFNTNDTRSGWDGSFRGTKLLPDVYIYVISFADAENKTQTIQGDVALLR
jgi:gliding motility-associated-like protein